MNRLAPLFALLLTTLPLAAQDVFVPPVPKGIVKDGTPLGRVRTPTTPIPFPAESTAWIRLRTPRFDFISSATESETRAIANDIETLGNALHAPVKATPTTVFVFSKRRESQPYFDLLFARENATSTGAYVRHSGGGTMFIDGSRKARIERTAMHEMIHDLLGARNVTPPLWLEEGLAEYFANATVNGDEVIAGEPIDEHLAWMQRRNTLSIDELLAVKAESENASLPGFYAQSWAAVDWLMSLDQAAFFRFLDDVAKGANVEQSLQTHFRKTKRDLDAGLRRRDRSATRVVLKSPRNSEEPEEPEELPRPTLLYELARFLSHVAGAEKDVRRHYGEALRVDPHHARTLAALGNFEAAVKAGPNDPEVHLLYAEKLLDTAIGPFAGTFEATPADAEKFRKARALAERAVTIGGDEARARGLIGASHLVERDLARGIAQLERARALDGSRVDVALNLYAMYLRTAEREKAEALYAAAFANARDRQTVFAARNVRYVAEAARANDLTAAGKLDEAAVVVRELAAATADVNGRRELELQAAKLESIGAVNRHITMYNEAIALTNAQKYKQAMKLVDELLKVATDAQVLKDAAELKKDLRKRMS